MAHTAKTYFAYGMNMDTAGMAHRCPTAKFLGTGMLEHTALVFKGCASIGAAPNNPDARTPVAIWEIHPEDEDALDLLEGFPSYYRKETVTATLPDGSTVDGMVYIMNGRKLAPPSEYYYNLIHDAYVDLGLRAHLPILRKAARVADHASSMLARYE